MVVPFITSISRDVFATVPPILKESAYGLGCTTREVVGNVIIPYTRVGIIGLYTSSLIALGLILFGITFIILAIARFMLMRIEQKAR